MDRYANDNDYDLFRRTYWDARNPDIPLQSAREWFHVEAGEDSDSDDIQIARQTESYKCPITQREFTDPVRVSQCGHTFERDAILQLVGHNPSMICPANGCSQNFARKDLKPNKFIMMKLARHRATEERRKRKRDMARDMARENGDAGGEEEEKEVEEEQRPRAKVKNEPSRTRRTKRRDTVFSVDDDE